MRWLVLTSALVASGCASTVYRLEGEPVTPAGAAGTACESEDWLVIAPTRADVAEEKTGKSHPENGLGLYRVGGTEPESIPSLERLPPSEMVTRKKDELAPYRTRQYVAAGLGTAGVIAIGIGTALFVTAFESHKKLGSDGIRHEESSVNGTKAGIGGAVVGLGFAFGISGLVVNPSYTDRTKANASRFVFLDPPDSEKAVQDLVKRHDEQVRETCKSGGTPD